MWACLILCDHKILAIYHNGIFLCWHPFNLLTHVSEKHCFLFLFLGSLSCQSTRASVVITHTKFLFSCHILFWGFPRYTLLTNLCQPRWENFIDIFVNKQTDKFWVHNSTKNKRTFLMKRLLWIRMKILQAHKKHFGDLNSNF